MLKLPEALPISAGATALNTAFCDAGMASGTPAPAINSGATSCAKASSGVAMNAIQAKPNACVNRPALTSRRSPKRLTRLPPIGAKTNKVAVQGRRRKPGSIIDGEDVVQDALIKAIEAFAQARPIANV